MALLPSPTSVGGFLLTHLVEGTTLNLCSYTISLVHPKGLTRSQCKPTSGHGMTKDSLYLSIEPYGVRGSGEGSLVESRDGTGLDSTNEASSTLDMTFA